MIKHCKITYYCPDEDEYCQEKCSMSFDYNNEEELNKYLEEYDKEISSEKWNFKLERRVQIFSEDEYIKELEKPVKEYVLSFARNLNKDKNFIIKSSKKERYFIHGVEVSRNKYHEALIEGENKTKSLKVIVDDNGVKYYKDEKAISSEEYEKASQEADKESYIRSLKLFNKIEPTEIIIRNTFDTSKLTVDDYNFILLMIANNNRSELEGIIEELKEKFSYALKKLA